MLEKGHKKRAFEAEVSALPSNGNTERKHAGALVITVIERLSKDAVTVCWRDATSCCYGDQSWRASRSRTTGICAMSGKAIERGDLVFRPSRRVAALNADAMILASVMQSATLE